MTAQSLIRELKALGACESLRFNETFENACAMITSHRGASFCVEANAPSLASWRDERLRRNVDVRRCVRVDERGLLEWNAERVVLVNCRGRLCFDLNRAFYVYLLHGSRVEIEASGFASVHVFGSVDSDVRVVKSDNAIVML